MLSWTFEEVERQLIEAMKLLWRLPAGGSSGSFATDGPWHLLTRSVRASAGASDRPGAAEWEALRNEIEQQHLRDMRNNARTVPLTTKEVDWMNGRLGWLELVDGRDRKLVFEALWQMTRGQARVSWTRIRRQMLAHPAWREVAVSPQRLGQRYTKAISRIAITLTDRRVAA